MKDSEFFEQTGFVVKENLIDKSIVDLATRYTFLEEKTLSMYYCEQSPTSLGKYGDLFYDTILDMLTPVISETVGFEVLPTYSYHRVYTNGAFLTPHTDRPACEISCSLAIYAEEEHNNPIYFSPEYPTHEHGGIKLILNPGSGVIYAGTKLVHWRNAFTGTKFIQAFLHYVAKDGTYSQEIFDNRYALGVNHYATPNDNQNLTMCHLAQKDLWLPHDKK